jgi:uncharacterized protein YndB with AHSA1/START domain
MDDDIIKQIDEAHRVVAGSGEQRSVLLRRRYAAPPEDVWDACTDPERIGRWFLPVTGDLRLGGSYQLQGNAGGTILRCEAPRLLRVTWVFGEGAPSEVEVRLAEADGDTLFELEHSSIVDPALWNKFGPGAVGVGWDLVLLGLYGHLRGDGMINPETFERSPEARPYVTASCQAWGVAHEASGASAEEAASAVAQTSAFYLPPVPDPGQVS